MELQEASKLSLSIRQSKRYDLTSKMFYVHDPGLFAMQCRLLQLLVRVPY